MIVLLVEKVLALLKVCEEEKTKVINEFDDFKMSYAKLELELHKCGDANVCLES